MISELAGAFFLGILSFSILWLSWKKGFFSLENKGAPIPIRWFHPISVFSIYAAVLFFAQPLLVSFLLKFVTPIPIIAVSCWLTFLLSLLSLVALLLYCTLLNKGLREKIWNHSTKSFSVQDVYFVFLSCAIAFPFLLFLGQFFDVLISFVFHLQHLPDQLAIVFLKMTFNHPFYFFLTLVTVTVFAPCIEETLFRGFLQSFIRQHLGPKLSISISSACFAFFHYAPEQGMANISIIGTLFALALFLGFIYEKKGSLLSPILLHALFNTISVVNLYFLESFSKTGS